MQKTALKPQYSVNNQTVGVNKTGEKRVILRIILEDWLRGDGDESQPCRGR